MNSLDNRQTVKTVVLTVEQLKEGDVVYYEPVPSSRNRTPAWVKVQRIDRTSSGSLVVRLDGSRVRTYFPYSPIKVQVFA